MQPRTRTAVTALTATAGGLALVLNFKTPSTDPTAGASTAANDNSSGASGGAGDSSSSSDSAADATATPGQSGSGTETITGPVESNHWGSVQVEITVEDGKITDVSLVQAPSSHGRSVEINDYAVPILVQETLTAQSAEIDMVSGATDTSESYIASLQGALDALGNT